MPHQQMSTEQAIRHSLEGFHVDLQANLDANTDLFRVLPLRHYVVSVCALGVLHGADPDCLARPITESACVFRTRLEAADLAATAAARGLEVEVVTVHEALWQARVETLMKLARIELAMSRYTPTRQG